MKITRLTAQNPIAIQFISLFDFVANSVTDKQATNNISLIAQSIDVESRRPHE